MWAPLPDACAESINSDDEEETSEGKVLGASVELPTSEDPPALSLGAYDQLVAELQREAIEMFLAFLQMKPDIFCEILV